MCRKVVGLADSIVCHPSSCRTCFAFAIIPQTQSRARPCHAGSAEDHNKERANNLSGWIHAQFSARRENGFA